MLQWEVVINFSNCFRPGLSSQDDHLLILKDKEVKTIKPTNQNLLLVRGIGSALKSETTLCGEEYWIKTEVWFVQPKFYNEVIVVPRSFGLGEFVTCRIFRWHLFLRIPLARVIVAFLTVFMSSSNYSNGQEGILICNKYNISQPSFYIHIFVPHLKAATFLEPYFVGLLRCIHHGR